ncbi:hypothetical protein G5I_14797 [Acromyrmex echinatior]|uniref:Uncharacterized protein n=1 Tax=Acromyrmex echinatior TaxID=103372 RepID=F4X8Q7_ACREC|nr:hypothetical protein G5I_14797 [Acromyrmex echinatior]
MEERVIKRTKSTKESAISDIVSSIDKITNSLKSISESYSNILSVNTAVVTYLYNTEKREKAINQSIEDTDSTLIREEQ